MNRSFTKNPCLAYVGGALNDLVREHKQAERQGVQDCLFNYQVLSKLLKFVHLHYQTNIDEPYRAESQVARRTLGSFAAILEELVQCFHFCIFLGGSNAKQEELCQENTTTVEMEMV